MARREASLAALGVAVVAIIALAIAVMVDARVSPAKAEDDLYARQLLILDTAWKQGQQARKTMIAHKIKPTAQRCGSLFRATEASRIGDDNFRAQGEQFFRYGCLNIKKME